MNRLLTLAFGLILTGCNVIPVSKQNDTLKFFSRIEPQDTAAEQTTLVKDPKHESLALEMASQTAIELQGTVTDTHSLWQQPLDLTRPNLYEKYPDDLYQILQHNFTFDLTLDNRRIAQQLKWYSSHQSYINRVSDRASRYLYYIVKELDARDMPMDLALLPIVESAFDPFAYSHGRASGMWQFIPGTGRMYGLKQNWWYDGRRDITASTDAALDYLEDLNKMFKGDWLLALASYNSGPGTVLKAQRRNRAKGKPTDFWNLDLPKETEAYVPKMFALAKLFHSPEKYGIVLPKISAQPFFAEVETGGQIDLAQAAKLADMNLSDLYLLNPAFNRWATDPDGPHKLLVFKDREEQFKSAIESLPQENRLSWQRYTIQNGDALGTIAKRFNVTVGVIRDVNNIRGNLIRAGDTLLIPKASQGDQSYSLSADNRLKTKQNSYSGSDKNRIDYIVQNGDTFWDIARAHNVDVRSLAKWNNMAPKDVIRPGQTLVIWTKQATTKVSTVSSTDRKVMRKVGYVVRKGDSLYRIANKFNLRVTDIQKWNKLPAKYLQPGDRLTLYVDVTRIQ